MTDEQAKVIADFMRAAVKVQVLGLDPMQVLVSVSKAIVDDAQKPKQRFCRQVPGDA
jgi:hypothetical protein